MHRANRFASLFLLTTLTACGASSDPANSDDDSDSSAAPLLEDIRPNGRHIGTIHNPPAPPAGRRSGSNGITYHGGPLMLGAVNFYYIWYGNWSGNTAPTILGDFAASLGGSGYWNINTTYTDANQARPTNAIRLAGSTSDAYSRGTALSDSAVGTIVSNAIGSGALPRDAAGIYFVITSADVDESSGFCRTYCAWHAHASMGGTDVKYAFIGNPDRCPSACSWQNVSPNGNAGADGMASLIAHEADEAVTDPDLNAWYDSRGYENADECAWTFGRTYTANGALANVHLGTRDFLIQQNWVNANGGRCAMAY
jgi:hypothetical protein